MPKTTTSGTADKPKATRARQVTASKRGKATNSKATNSKATNSKATNSKASKGKATEAKAGPGAAKATSVSAGDKFVEAQRKELLAEREAYTRSADTLRAEADQLAEDREPGDVQFDEESGEGDSMNVERERDLALSAQALASVEEIDRALAKIESGRYGVCDKCGEPIPKERLKALPHAALCVKCKSGGLSRR